MAVVDRAGPIADSWTRLADDQAPAAGATVIVSFARLKNEHNSLFSAAGKVGVEIAGDVKLEELEPFLPRLGLIVVRMNNMRDGRLFSIGRMLRENYKYAADMRAAGDLIPDQMLYLLRCGFTSFEVKDGFPIDSLRRSVAAYTHWYQRIANSATPVTELRHGAAHGGEP